MKLMFERILAWFSDYNVHRCFLKRKDVGILTPGFLYAYNNGMCVVKIPGCGEPDIWLRVKLETWSTTYKVEGNSDYSECFLGRS